MPSAAQVLPLDAELGGLVGGDLGDQRLDVDLRPAHVELVQRRAQIVVDRIGRGDDDRVGGRIGLDDAGRRRAAAAPAPAAPAPGARCGASAVPDGGSWRAAPRAASPRVDRAQDLRQLHRFGVLQVDDVNVAAGAGGRIEHRHQVRAPAASRDGIAGAREQAVRARIRDDGKALRRVRRRLRRLGEQAVDGLRDVERGGIAAAGS